MVERERPSASSEKLCKVVVRYNADYGYPELVDIDPRRDVFDDELGGEVARDGRRVLFTDSDVVFGPRLASELVDLVRKRRSGEEFQRDRAAISAHYNNAR